MTTHSDIDPPVACEEASFSQDLLRRDMLGCIIHHILSVHNAVFEHDHSFPQANTQPQQVTH